MDVRIERSVVALREPLRTSYGEVRERTLFRLEVGGGVGEAAPLEPYDGVPDRLVAEALEAYRPVLRDVGARPGHELLDACRRAADVPPALAAVDLALWDRAAKGEGRPVAALLADDLLDRVPVNATVGATDAAGAAAAAARAAAAGFRCVKLKVGAGDDARRVAAVRATVGPDVALRLDANGAWDVETAVRSIDALAPAGIEIVEEPVSGIEALRAVRGRVATRIAMDETAAEPGALASAATDVVVLKIARAGGIAALLAQAALVRALGGDVVLASSLDGPLGIAAAVHCAAALRVDLPCGLATLPLLGIDDVLPVDGGAIAVPRGPGLL